MLNKSSGTQNIKILLVLLVVCLMLVGCDWNRDNQKVDSVRRTHTPVAVFKPVPTFTPASVSTPELSREESSRELWTPAQFTVLELKDLSDARRQRHTLAITAPEADTMESRLATAMSAAISLYWQGHIENLVTVFLWDSPTKSFLLAKANFAYDKCGWTGDDCGDDYWTETMSTAVQFTDFQRSVYDAFALTYDRFSQSELAFMGEGQSVSEAGWDCFDVLDVPSGGGCFVDSGALVKNMNKKACGLANAQWLVPSMGTWGSLNLTCAQNKRFAHVASELSLTTDQVAETIRGMENQYYDNFASDVILPDWIRYREISGEGVPELASPTATPTPRPTPAPTREQTWYEGGTLHQGTLTDWRGATYDNKLATIADLVVYSLTMRGKEMGKDYDFEYVRFASDLIVKTVDEIANDASSDLDMTLAEVVYMIWSPDAGD